MLTTLVSLVVLFGFTSAQNSTVSLFIPAADNQGLLGSIVGSVRHPFQSLSFSATRS